jgi:hypothetical protein
LPEWCEHVPRYIDRPPREVRGCAERCSARVETIRRGVSSTDLVHDPTTSSSCNAVDGPWWLTRAATPTGTSGWESPTPCCAGRAGGCLGHPRAP